MKFTAVGDFLIQKPYKTPYEGFEKIKEFIARGDFRFFNLETTLNEEGSCYASQHSGGSYLRVDPCALDTAKSYGFNVLTNNNNHAFDFEINGFLSTLKCLDKSGLVYGGTGLSLPEAAKPVYIKTENGTAAMIAVSMLFSPADIAGNPSEHYPGRPGVNGIRAIEEVLVTKEQKTALKTIAEETGINVYRDSEREAGYLPELPDDVFEFSNIRMQVADKPGKRTIINSEDSARIANTIKEAKNNADYVIVSLHNHDIAGIDEEIVPQHLIDFSHDCIDNGASAVIGHGPHLLRAIEIYSGCPIFHSLGDFVLQLNSIQSAPADFYEKHGVKVDAGIKELLRIRSNNGKRGLMYDRKMMESVIPFFEFNNGKLTRLELLPVELGFDEDYEDEMRGIPRPANANLFFERFKSISEPFGTKMCCKGDRIIVEL